MTVESESARRQTFGPSPASVAALADDTVRATNVHSAEPLVSCNKPNDHYHYTVAPVADGRHVEPEST